MTPNNSWHPEDDFLTRVKLAYCAAVIGHHDRISPWTTIDDRRQSIHEALRASGNDALRTIFADPGSTDLFYGADNLFRAFLTDWSANPQADANAAKQTRSDLVGLMVAIGLHRVRASTIEDDFEQIDIEASLQKLDSALRQTTLFTNHFSGLQTSRGVASYRAVQALYQAWRLSRIIRPRDRGSVLEIGPGLGRTAYYAFKMGIGDYTTVDLPLGIVAQACFLGATLGPDLVWMIGDNPSMAPGRICLLPPSKLDKIQQKFDIVLNVDLMTEMSSDVAAKYVRWIAKSADVFLSINHEANVFTVAELASAHFAPRIKTVRSPYWMRGGYVEEIFATGSELVVTSSDDDASVALGTAAPATGR